MEKDFYKEQVLVAFRVLRALTITLFVCFLITLCTGCRSVKYVTVPEVHEVIREKTDTLRQTDSIVKEKETVVMQLDSAAMAEYGIKLKNKERAWLVRTNELEQQLKYYEHLSSVKDTIRDSIPFPVTVEKEVEKKLNWWQKFRLGVANTLFIIIGLYLLVVIFRYRGKFLKILGGGA